MLQPEAQLAVGGNPGPPPGQGPPPGAGPPPGVGPHFLTAIAFEHDAGGLGDEDIAFIKRDGSGLHIRTAPTSRERTPQWSPDGRQLVFASNQPGNFDIFVSSGDGSNAINVTNTPGVDEFAPDWSPDGGKLVFSFTGGGVGLAVVNADGSERQTVSTSIDFEPAWSPDGSSIAFNRTENGNVDIYIMSSDGSTLTRLTTDPAVDARPAWSRDGSQIAFETFRDGNWEIYVMDSDGDGQTNVTNSPQQEFRANWSPGAKIVFDRLTQIFAINPDGTGIEMIPNLPAGFNVSADWSR
ncbi:MAG: hypothetical protein R3195_20475 [Gemmatimonadota bacterium]|nr:hypothetical protein [Gemmatimonadota bacterium]